MEPKKIIIGFSLFYTEGKILPWLRILKYFREEFDLPNIRPMHDLMGGPNIKGGQGIKNLYWTYYTTLQAVCIMVEEGEQQTCLNSWVWNSSDPKFFL